MTCERFLLCRPEGGLNDVLVSIQWTRQYADKFHRTLIVDTNFVNAEAIKDDFSNYFYTADPVILNMHTIADRLRDLTVFPTCVAGKVDSYQVYYDKTLGSFVEQTTGERISFEFRDYKEQLLVHHRSGGGPLGLNAFFWLRPTEVISTELLRRLSMINAPYIAVHIRNTDYRTDYVRHLNLVRSQLAALDCNNLFIATDNIECLNYCRQLFSSLNVFSFSSLPTIAVPLHRNQDPSRRLEMNADSILDLFMLALSNHLVIMPLAPGSPAKWSGFSFLAYNLRSNVDLLRRLAPGAFAKLDFLRQDLPMQRESALNVKIQSNAIGGVISRNAPCPCGSGKRYKHCCGQLTVTER